MYRKTKKYAAICEKMRVAKERRRMSGAVPEYPPALPDLRRRIIVEDYDCGRTVRHEFVLHKTRRIDCYRVVVDGVDWKASVGWSKIIEGLRKAFPRMRATP